MFGSQPKDGPPRARTLFIHRLRAAQRRSVIAKTMVVLAASAIIAPVVATQGTSFAVGTTLPGGLVVSGAVPAASQFDVTGFIQTATLDVPGDPHSGGTVTVNGQTIVVRFESVEAAKAWYWSDAYQAATRLRQAAAESNVIIVSGPA